MDTNPTLLIGAAIAIGFLIVLRWIFTPRRKSRGAAPHAPPAPSAPGTEGAWDGAARRRRDLAT